jgi:hypothetical protein
VSRDKWAPVADGGRPSNTVGKKVNFTLLQASWPGRRGRGIALPILNLGTRGGGWSAPRPGRFTPGKDPVPILQEAGWAPGPVGTCAKNLAPTGIRSPDRPARSQSLYRLSYRALNTVGSCEYINPLTPELTLYDEIFTGDFVS